MAAILVYVETQKGEAKKSSLELLSWAQDSGLEVHAFAVGSGSRAALANCAAYGCKSLLAYSDSGLDSYNSEKYLSVAVDALKKTNATRLLASSSSAGKDLFPRVAARLGGGVLSDCTSLSLKGESFVVKRPVYSGKATSTVEFSSEANPQIVLMRPNQLNIAPGKGGGAAVNEVTAASTDLKTLLKEVVKGASEKLDLTEANIIVSGGRGLKEASNFKILEPLAEVLGATLGASRAVVDAGWVGHSLQVGQTGKTVAPTLYIAVGISGAIQHLAGMSGSKVIVAINSDPNAPIFQKATYGIVGDLFEVVPKLTEEFRKVLG